MYDFPSKSYNISDKCRNNQEGRGHWTRNYDFTQSFYKPDHIFAGLKTLGTFIKT